MTQKQTEFIETVAELTLENGRASEILPSLTIAQAILESGWGTSGLTQYANALFGIKAGSEWKGRVYSCNTMECYDGVNFTTETGCFRAYPNWGASIADHAQFLCSLSRYAAVIGEKDWQKACLAIQKAGYATDPDYAEKLMSIIRSYDLTKYDLSPETSPAGKCWLVEPGDTLTCIACKNDTTIDAILAQNRIKYPTITENYIQAGWVLLV